MSKQGKTLVIESNQLIEASYRFNIWEDRVFLMVLSQIKPTDAEFKKYKIYIRDLVQEHGIKDNDIYSRVREAAMRLQGKKIAIPCELDGEMTMLNTVLFISYTDVVKKGDGLSYIAVELHPELKPYLLQLKREFTQYNIFFMMKMQSSHSRRIYKLLKQYQKIGKRKMQLSQLREILCLKETEYKRYSDFKKRVIVPAQEDLAKYTDLQFSFEEERKGRRVEWVTFYIRGEEIEELENVVADTQNELSDDEKAVFELIQTWGITKTAFLKCLEARNLNHLQKCVDVVQSSKNVQNKAAYFMKLAKEDEVINTSKLAALENEAKKQQEKAINEQTIKAQKEAEKSKALQYKNEQRIVANLLQDVAFVEQVKTELFKSSFARYDENLSFADNLKKPSVKAAVHTLVLRLKPEAFV